MPKKGGPDTEGKKFSRPLEDRYDQHANMEHEEMNNIGRRKKVNTQGGKGEPPPGKCAELWPKNNLPSVRAKPQN